MLTKLLQIKKRNEVNVMVKINAIFLESQKTTFENGSNLYCYSFVNSDLGVFKVYSLQYFNLEFNSVYDIELGIKKDLKKQTLKFTLKEIC